MDHRGKYIILRRHFQLQTLVPSRTQVRHKSLFLSTPRINIGATILSDASKFAELGQGAPTHSLKTHDSTNETSARHKGKQKGSSGIESRFALTILLIYNTYLRLDTQSLRHY